MPADKPGRHDFRFTATVEFHDTRDDRLLSTVTKTLTASPTVLAEPSTIRVRLVKGKSSRLHVRSTGFLSEGGDWSIEYSSLQSYPLRGVFLTTIDISSPPFGLAYDVVVMARGKQITAGQLVQAKGTNVEWSILAKWPGGDIPSVRILFTPNPELARRSIDVREVWDQPLELWPSVSVYENTDILW